MLVLGDGKCEILLCESNVLQPRPWFLNTNWFDCECGAVEWAPSETFCWSKMYGMSYESSRKQWNKNLKHVPRSVHCAVPVRNKTFHDPVCSTCCRHINQPTWHAVLTHIHTHTYSTYTRKMILLSVKLNCFTNLLKWCHSLVLWLLSNILEGPNFIRLPCGIQCHFICICLIFKLRCNRSLDDDNCSFGFFCCCCCFRWLFSRCRFI